MNSVQTVSAVLVLLVYKTQSRQLAMRGVAGVGKGCVRCCGSVSKSGGSVVRCTRKCCKTCNKCCKSRDSGDSEPPPHDTRSQFPDQKSMAGGIFMRISPDDVRREIAR